MCFGDGSPGRQAASEAGKGQENRLSLKFLEHSPADTFDVSLVRSTSGVWAAEQ